MTRIDDITRGELASILKRLRALEKATPLSSTSVGNGTLRFYAGSELSIEDGNLTVSGTATVTGELTGGGTFSWTGPVTLTGTTTMTGTTNLNGPVNIAGVAHITGATTVSGNFTVDTSGQIVVQGASASATLTDGQLSFSTGAILQADSGGVRLIAGTGPRVYVFPTAVGLQYDPSHYVQVTSAGTNVTGGLQTDTLSTAGAKLFRMEHPTKPGYLLQHGATESPVSGIEYWGTGELDADGATTVKLPDYFEALAKPENRAVFITGRGFAADWTDIQDGSFVVSGIAGGKFSWLVKAERRGGDFTVEEPGETSYGLTGTP